MRGGTQGYNTENAGPIARAIMLMVNSSAIQKALIVAGEGGERNERGEIWGKGGNVSVCWRTLTIFEGGEVGRIGGREMYIGS